MVNYSIVIPAHNEEKLIVKTLKDYYRVFRDEAEILVVANGCSDRTYYFSRNYAKGKKSLKIINIPAAIGKGGAVLEGFKRARGNYIGFVDADGSTSAEEYLRLTKFVESADGVIASRWLKDSHVVLPQPLARKIASRVFNLLVRVLFGLPYSDTQCGAKLFSREAIRDIVSYIGITDWAFDIDMLYLLKRRGYDILEVPTVWKDRVESNLNIKNVSIKMFLAILRLRLIYSPVQKYYLLFRPLTKRIYYFCLSLSNSKPPPKSSDLDQPSKGDSS